MKSAIFAREAILNGDGADFSWPITFTGTIVAFSGNVSLGFPMGFIPATTANVPNPSLTPAPFAEALINCWISSGQPTFSNDPPAFYTGPPTPGLGDFGGPTPYVTAGQPVTIFGDGPPVPGGLFSMILKTSPPAGVQLPFGQTNLSIPVTPGQFVVFHADASSLPPGTPIDVEWGMTVFYTIP